MADGLSESAYYTEVKVIELSDGQFEKGESGERLPAGETIAAAAEELGTGLVLFVEVMDSKMWTSLGGRIGYGFGLGRSYYHGSLMTSFETGTSYWDTQARMLIGLSLARPGEESAFARTVEAHSYSRSYADTIPSESDVFEELISHARARILTYVDVYYYLSPRRLRTDGTDLVAEGVYYARLGGEENWDTASHFWTSACSKNSRSVAANYNLGVASEIREDYEQAVSYYVKARQAADADDAFESEINEATRSAKVLFEFGSAEGIQPEKEESPEPEDTKSAKPVEPTPEK
jgi:hypothetical protein